MAKKLSAATDSEVASAIRTVFVDTSLDTHLAMVLSDLDTVSDLKRKIAKEHALCFTNVGCIVAHALKVKRKGHLYHLSDSMFVKDAFDGANKNWFLSVDVSIVQNKHNEERLVHKPDSQNLLTCHGVLCNTAANAVDLSLSVSPKQGTSDPNKGREVPQKHVGHKSDASKRAILEQHDKSVKEASQSDCTAKRKWTSEDKVGNERLQDESIDTCRDISKREIVSQRALGDKEKSQKAALGGLASKPVDDNHPVTNNSSIEKRKRRKKSNSEFDQAGAADQSAARDVLEESYMTATAVGQRASGGEPDTSSVPGQGENGINHSNVIRDAGEYVFSSEDEHESDAPEEEATSLATKMGNSKDHYPFEVESNHPLVVEKHDNLPVGMRNSGQDDIGTDQAERSEEQGALSKKKGSLKTQLNKHDNLPLDIGISRQKNVGSGQAGRAEKQGDLMKKKGSAKMLPEKHDDLPLDTGISGHENIASVQAGRVEEQGSLSKKKDSLTMRSQKDDNLSTEVSGQENVGSGQAGRAEEQGDLTKKKGSAKMLPEEHDNLPLDTGISGHENIASVQAGRVEEQGSLSKKKDSLTMWSQKDDNLSTEVSGQENVGSGQAGRAEEQGDLTKKKGSAKMLPEKHDDLPLDTGISGHENIASVQAGRVEEQGSLSKKKDSLTMRSQKDDNLSTKVSGQENVGSEQAERAEEQGPFSKTRDSFKMQPKKLDDLPAEVGVSGQENIKSGQAEIAEDQRALSQRKDSLKTQLKKLNSRRPDDTEDANATADLLGENGTVEPTESSKKRRRNKRTKDLVQKIVTTSVMEAVEGSEINVSVKSRGAKGCEPPIDGARNEESILSQTNGKEELRSNAESTFLAKENGEFTGNEVKSMWQTSKYEENAENVKEKVGQRSKKKQKSAKKLSDLQLEDRRVIHQNSAAQADNKSQAVASSDTKDKGNLKKRAVKGNLNEEKRETESLEVQKDLVSAQPTQSNLVLAKSTKVQSKSLDHKNKGNAGEADLLDNPLNSADKASKEIEISVEGNRGNFEKPLPENVTSSGVLIDKKIGANKVANKVAKTPKAKKNIEKPDTQSDQTSADFQSSVKSNKKQGIEGKPPAGKSSTDPLQGSSLSKDNADESAVQPKKNLLKASRNEAKAPPSDVSGKVKSTPKKTKAQNVVSVSNIKSQKNTGLASVSNSHVESSRKLISKDVATNKVQPGLANAKAANKGNGKTVNSLKPSKKLRATSGAIFRDDDSGESSEDEGVDGSDARTKTPSDYSESSDYSDGESNANFNSPRKGSYTSDRSKSVGRSTMKSCSSSAKDLNFRSLLTSSSRFKKAKLTASQLQLEDPDESQPVEFVPDSLPIE